MVFNHLCYVGVSRRSINLFAKWSCLSGDATVWTLSVSSQSQIPLCRPTDLLPLWIPSDPGVIPG